MTKETLKKKAQNLPLLPGVYLMEDAFGNIIYIGKSKALKNRVSSYFGGSQKPSKVERMVRCIHDFSIQLTDTELDALILECRLIKKYKPLYNRLLKQDHKYRYLYLNSKEQRPRIKLVREQTQEGDYFGPYEKGSSLFEAVQAVNEYYQLPDCKPYDIKEACLTYKRQKCLGPCKKPFEEERFKNRLESVQRFLKGEDLSIITFYQTQMEKAAKKLAFEEALALKEKWMALRALHFRKEAIDFAVSNRVTLLLLERPEGGKKLYLWIGTRMIQSKVIKNGLNQRRLEILFQSMKEALLHIQEIEKSSLKKEAIDEIQIVYNALKKQPEDTCQSFEFQEDIKKNEQNFKKAWVKLFDLQST